MPKQRRKFALAMIKMNCATYNSEIMIFKNYNYENTILFIVSSPFKFQKLQLIDFKLFEEEYI